LRNEVGIVAKGFEEELPGAPSCVVTGGPLLLLVLGAGALPAGCDVLFDFFLEPPTPPPTAAAMITTAATTARMTIPFFVR